VCDIVVQGLWLGKVDRGDENGCEEDYGSIIDSINL